MREKESLLAATHVLNSISTTKLPHRISIAIKPKNLIQFQIKIILSFFFFNLTKTSKIKIYLKRQTNKREKKKKRSLGKSSHKTRKIKINSRERSRKCHTLFVNCFFFLLLRTKSYLI